MLLEYRERAKDECMKPVEGCEKKKEIRGAEESLVAEWTRCLFALPAFFQLTKIGSTFPCKPASCQAETSIYTICS